MLSNGLGSKRRLVRITALRSISENMGRQIGLLSVFNDLFEYCQNCKDVLSYESCDLVYLLIDVNRCVLVRP